MKPSRELNWWEHYQYHKVWCNDLCPLVPRISYRKKDEYNAADIGIHWLILHAWTMSHASISIDVELSPSRIGIGFILPYLRIWIGFAHMYGKVNEFFYNYLSRKGTIK